jgi:hypothetical protein
MLRFQSPIEQRHLVKNEARNMAGKERKQIRLTTKQQDTSPLTSCAIKNGEA